MEQQQPKSNLLAEFAKRKADVKKARKNSNFFEGGPHGRFARPTNDRPNPVRSGRNAQGKP